jgi:hypothetical protein
MKRIFVIFFIFCLTILIWQVTTTRNENLTLKKNGRLTYGQVVSFSEVGKYGEGVTYTFNADNRLINEEREETKLEYKYFDLFRGKTFPVIYDPENPKVNHILLTKADFQFFNVPIPDTLKDLIVITK